MVPCSAARRKGFSLIELIVVMFCVGMAVCLGMVLVGRGRENSLRLQCTNNLRPLGLAMHTYHDTNDAFPSETLNAPGENVPQSIYVQLLPYLCMRPSFPPVPVKVFLCPSRRTTAVGAKRDYGYGGSRQPGSIGTSILDAPAPCTFSAIANKSGGGAEYTALLSHVWMDPRNYGGGDPTDLGWHTLNNSRSCNSNLLDGSPSGNVQAIGSPHPNSNPFLFADGHVQNISYGWSQLPNIWAYDNTAPITIPD